MKTSIQLLALAVTLLLGACASAPTVNTAFPYKMEADIQDDAGFKRLVVAHVNLAKPSRSFLRRYEARVDDFMKQYLKDAGYTLVSSALFEQAWDQAVRKHGEPYNETNGKINQRSLQLVLHTTLTDLKDQDIADGVIFTDLLERKVQYTSGLQHVARWDGVSRKPSLQGPGSGVPGDFNWAAQVDAVSLWINIYDMQLRQVFQSAGGIEVTQAIDMKSSNPGFIRRRTVLGNRAHIMEGIKLALHPLVKMKGYPQ